MRQELFGAIIEGMNVLSPIDHVEIFIQEHKSSPRFKIAFDKSDREKEFCVNIISDSSYCSRGSWPNYLFCIFFSTEKEITEEDAIVPLTEEQEEMLLDAIQMMML